MLWGESRCPISDLPRTMCAHCCHIPTETPVIGPPVAAPHPTPVGAGVQLDYGLLRSERQREWHTTDPGGIACDHGRPEGMVLCSGCEAALWRALADVPRLVADLEIHHSKQNVFLERGVTEDDPETLEESPLPYAEAASSTLGDLRRVLGPDPTAGALAALKEWRTTLRLPHLAEFAGRVSRAVAKGMRVIDIVPYLTHYGRCPTCHTDIRQERGETVTCGACNYTAKVGEHLQTQLEFGADERMPLTRLVQVLCDAGERATRQEIENLIYREGVPREQLPVWSGGRLERVWHYRLGDVRDYRAKKSRRS